MSNTSVPVQSIDRVFDIVEVLSDAPQGMLLSELSAATQLHASTTHRLLTALCDRGYVRKDSPRGKYVLTLRLFEIGCRANGAMDLMTIARPLLDRLSDISKEAVHLVQREGADVVYLYKAEPLHQLVRMSSFIGRRNPMYCTGVGKSILAMLPSEEVLEIWKASDVFPHTPNTILEFEALEKELSQVHRDGYAMDREEHEQGVCCIAAVVRNWNGAPIAAISISAPTSRMDAPVMEDLIPHVQETAMDISKQLGFRQM